MPTSKDQWVTHTECAYTSEGRGLPHTVSTDPDIDTVLYTGHAGARLGCKVITQGIDRSHTSVLSVAKPTGRETVKSTTHRVVTEWWGLASTCCTP